MKQIIFLFTLRVVGGWVQLLVLVILNFTLFFCRKIRGNRSNSLLHTHKGHSVQRRLWHIRSDAIGCNENVEDGDVWLVGSHPASFGTNAEAVVAFLKDLVAKSKLFGTNVSNF